jgi:Zn-dependent protease
MAGTLRLLTIRGIPIAVHVSWLIVYALITWTLAVGYFPRALPELPHAAYWISGLVAALLLFASVLLHELSHAFIARAQGLRVRGITLHVFGGVSHIEDEARTPGAEFWIAVVGPLTSLALAGALWLLRATTDLSGAPRAVLDYLVVVNAAVGLFNLMPGFPLDGGRVLRAVLWRWQGSLERATTAASQVGVAFAYGLIGLGVLQILGGGHIGGLWTVLLGLFLSTAADASATHTSLRAVLSGLQVADVMVRDIVTIDADASVASLVEHFWSHHVTSFPVVDNGVVIGIASVQQVHEVPREQWSDTRVRAVMRPLEDALTIEPGRSVFEALERASSNGLGRLAVLERQRLVGYLSLKDITHVMALRGLGQSRPALGWPGRASLRRAA